MTDIAEQDLEALLSLHTQLQENVRYKGIQEAKISGKMRELSGYMFSPTNIH